MAAIFIASNASWVKAQDIQTDTPGEKSAVVLLYHRFGENNLPTTNIRLEQFDEHIKLLTSGLYSVLSVPEVVARLKNKTPFAPRTITITVDDAYKSVMTEGWPRLKAAGLPMTLFVSTDSVDGNNPNYMNWDDIRRLKSEGVTIGHHTASHLHMIHEGVEKSLADVKRASTRFMEELGEVPTLFAYPYGEYDLELITEIKAMGFDIAFSQYSGPAAFWTNPFALPRFPVNERFGNSDRFSLISQTLALQVEDVTPLNPVLNEGRNPPISGFTVDRSVRGLSAIACYPSHLGRAADISILSDNRLEIRFDLPFPSGRNRINCTLPAGGGRWYWFGQFFYVPGGKLD
jgi:peptidoglycan/xylan/chitin deacetylase (PgdA/CDA1 family)